MLKVLYKSMITLILLVALLALASVAFLYLAPTFGAKPSGVSKTRIEQSPQYKDGIFVNTVATEVDTRQPGESMELATYIFPAKDKNPTKPLPSEEFDNKNFKEQDFVWFGHSTLMFRLSNMNIVTDPVFHRASPIPIGGKPFAMEVTPTIESLPNIDVVIISHDHYDHLDHLSIGKLATKVKLFLVPLGIRDHLLRWGVADENIIELDWYEKHDIADITFTLTPARHFSGRGITNRNSTLWGSWVVKNPNLSVFYSGDSGYFDGFKSIGEQFGPFDISFMENGAYNKQWAQIHMQPEESVQAAIDLKSKVFFPIHWGKFDLAKHKWQEPIERATQMANDNNMPIAAPLIGQVFRLESVPFEEWWKTAP